MMILQSSLQIVYQLSAIAMTCVMLMVRISSELNNAIWHLTGSMNFAYQLGIFIIFLYLSRSQSKSKFTKKVKMELAESFKYEIQRDESSDEDEVSHELDSALRVRIETFGCLVFKPLNEPSISTADSLRSEKTDKSEHTSYTCVTNDSQRMKLLKSQDSVF